MQPGGSGPSMATTPFWFGAGQLLAGALVDQLDVVAVHRHARAAELAGRLLDAVGNGQDRPAGFGLPVVVDDGLAQRLGDPLRGRLVQRLAGQEQRAQRSTGRTCVRYAGSCFFSTRTAVGALNIAVTLYFSTRLHQMPASGRDRQAFVHDGRHAGDQRAVDDVAVADHPADVAGGEVGLAGAGRRRCASCSPPAPRRSRRCRAARPWACRWCRWCRACSSGASASTQTQGTAVFRCCSRSAA